MISNQSAVKKNSYMMINGTAGLNSAMTALMVPNSHKRRSGYKLSLMSGTNKQQQAQLGPTQPGVYNPNELLFSGSKYEQSEEETSMTNSSSKKPIGCNSNSNDSAFKLGGSSSMNLYPAISVDEESSDSDDEEMLQEEDQEPSQSPRQMYPYQFNPKNFYWLFNPELKFSKRHDFSLDEDIQPNDFMDMRRLNRKILTHFFKTLGEGCGKKSFKVPIV